MGVPGTDADNHGITVWEPTAIYGNANSDKKDDILRFMEFYTSDEALDAFTAAQKPDGHAASRAMSFRMTHMTELKRLRRNISMQAKQALQWSSRHL